ncbi:glycosyltransferase family 9 protein [Pigmentiphaga soli]|uniref:Glycosyltransferase family 9 protein n=1 Tax=Pigmentiphaga soli TaxID=1007095 RepID=A0ABP8HND3_9BURK
MCLPALELLRASGRPLVLCGRGWAADLLAGFGAAGFVAAGAGIRADAAALRTARRASLPHRAAARDTHAHGVVFPNSLSSAAAFRLAGIAAAGYRGDGRSLLLRWPFARSRGPLHEVEVFYRLARQSLVAWRWADAPPAGPMAMLRLPLTAGHEAGAAGALAQAGVEGGFVLLAPTVVGTHQGRPKAWPHFGELALALERAGHRCVVCPPAAEADAARAAVPAATVLPPLSLGAFAALARRAALVVCNDSGASHVAAAVGARQITLFGVTRRERTGPWSPNAECLGSHDAWPGTAEVADAALRLLAASRLDETS